MSHPDYTQFDDIEDLGVTDHHAEMIGGECE